MVRPPKANALFDSTIRKLLVMRRLLSDIERFSDRAELIVVLPLCPVSISAYDFSQTAELIHRPEAATRLWLKKDGLHGGPRAWPVIGIVILMTVAASSVVRPLLIARRGASCRLPSNSVRSIGNRFTAGRTLCYIKKPRTSGRRSFSPA